MELFKIACTAIGSLAVLFLLTKLIGTKQMSQLNMFDYINGITIGSIAAEMATSLEADFLKPLVAMLAYGAAITLIELAANKSLKLRRFFVGRAVVLYDNGMLYTKNFARTRMTVSEFLTQCRVNGYFNLADIQTAYMEADGRVSVLPRSTVRPISPADIQITPQQETAVKSVILDGHILHENLKMTGNNEQWLEKNLSAQDIKHVRDVFYATCDADNNLSVYVKVKKAPHNDPFQ